MIDVAQFEYLIRMAFFFFPMVFDDEVDKVAGI